MSHHPSRGARAQARGSRRSIVALTVLALAGPPIGCDLPPAPTSVRRSAPISTPGDPPPSPPPVSVSSVWCDPRNVEIAGFVTERTSQGSQPVADAMVNGRFPPAAFDPAMEGRTDATGRYRFCRAVTDAACNSGVCSLPFEIRAHKDGYTTATTTVTVDYNAWWFNYFAASDLELARK